ncbi:MAG: glycine--tRNA ligase [Planctomycetaceae bacterium]|nr:glycine--tRNA ligase [Planctomycetaceae bacterium]
MSKDSDNSNQMDKIVALCKRKGFIFQNSEIYGGQNGFWDYGPLGVELKRNVREAWWQDMVNRHDPLDAPEGAPSAFQMVGVDTAIIMHPQVWKCSGHYDLFVDKMVDCKQCKSRYRADHLRVVVGRGYHTPGEYSDGDPVLAVCTYMPGSEEADLSVGKIARLSKDLDKLAKEHGLSPSAVKLPEARVDVPFIEYLSWLKEGLSEVSPTCPKAGCNGELTEPRDFNLMFKTIVGALGTEDDAAFLRPETAQGIFVNFKNVVDSSRVKVPFGVAQIGKSFRNEITPRNFTFRSREFEQMEIEFFCHPDSSQQWYQYWRDRRFAWYTSLGIGSERLTLRDHDADELSHYSVGTADIEYQFPFMAEGEFGELEGIAHRGDFDLRSHMEGKLMAKDGKLEVQLDEHGQPKWRGSGKDLTYFDDQAKERFTPHVIEPSAGADRATLAFICEAYYEDEQPDEKGEMQSRTVMRFHPRLAPVKVAVLPLIKKAGMPEKAKQLFRDLKSAGIAAQYDEQAAIGRRYRRQDEIGTPWCITIDGQTVDEDNTVTLRDRDTLEQVRLPIEEVVNEISNRLRSQ